MRKGLFRHFKFSMFRGLFLSLLGVVLLTCGVMSLIMLNQSVKNMRKEEGRLLESKLYTIITDLENQVASMKEVMADVSYRQEFKWDSIRNNKYNEIAAIAQMKSYVKVNNIWDMCFVKYPGYDNIMTSNADVTPVEVYLANLYGKENVQEVLVLLEELYRSKDKICVAYSRGKTTLFLVPTVRYGENNLNRIVVGFEVPSGSIEKRIKGLVGELGGDIQIQYNEKIIYGGGELPQEKAQVLEYISPDGDFQIRYSIDEHDYLSWEPIFTFENIIGFVVAGLLIMGLVFALTFWNYRPVRKLATKYIPAQGGDIQPALASIDQLIDNLLKSKEKDSRVLQEQYKALREQVAYMIVSGYSGDALKNHMMLLNIDYESSVFGVISCEIPEHVEVPDMGMLTTAIGDLAGEEVLLYPCHHKGMGLKVLAVVEEVYQFNEALELLGSLFETMKLDIVPRLSARSSDLENWWHLTEEQSMETTAPVKINDKQKRVVGQVLEYVQQHYAEYDLSLDFVAAQFTTHPAYLSRIIKQDLGIGYKEYLMELRMNKAKELLLDPRVSVADVCQKIGYANTSHFIKLFQKHTGMTPAKYRDEYCKERQEET